jgi:5-methylcytosine-specific restriction endonuclease McrA
MEATLLLNMTYEPLRVISWKRAVTLLYQGKVEVLEEYAQEIHGLTISFRLPSVLRLLMKIKPHHQAIKFSRQNIFARDKYQCQYCHQRLHAEDLTFDHVVPLARGGKTTWTNIVTACVRCNSKKSGHTLQEAGMRLLKAPVQPHWSPLFTLTIGFRTAPASWQDYLYWNISLSEEATEPPDDPHSAGAMRRFISN